MQISDLTKVHEELDRFLEALKNMDDEIKSNPHATSNDWIRGCKETGALKRASMDLTRALVLVRKNP